MAEVLELSTTTQEGPGSYRDGGKAWRWRWFFAFKLSTSVAAFRSRDQDYGLKTTSLGDRGRDRKATAAVGVTMSVG